MAIKKLKEDDRENNEIESIEIEPVSIEVKKDSSSKINIDRYLSDNIRSIRLLGPYMDVGFKTWIRKNSNEIALSVEKWNNLFKDFLQHEIK